MNSNRRFLGDGLECLQVDVPPSSKAFCPTGPGGGIDNSCSPKGGKKQPHELSPDELLSEMLSLVNENEERKSKNAVARKLLENEFKKAEAVFKQHDVPPDKEAAEVAKQKWLAATGDEKDAAWKEYVVLREPVKTPEYLAAQQLVRERGAAVREFNEKARDENDISDRAMELIRLPPDQQSKLTVTIEGKAQSKKNVINKGVEQFQAVVHKDAIGSASRVVFKEGDIDRAHYSGYGDVSLASHNGKATVIHELGHWLDDVNQNAAKAAVEWRRSVTDGAVLKWLGKPYKPEEKFKDRTDGKKWISNYMGKVYSNHGRISSEITSMGLELYATKPLELAKKDPEMFTLVAGIARGKYKKS